MASVLLIITGSIAAYKSLDVVRRLREQNVQVTGILTKGGAEFITPLSVAALTGAPVYGELFSLKEESEMGHIRLSREHDLIAVIPASADFIAKMAAGFADDLATATLLASDKKVMIAPAMNRMMWNHNATKRNLSTLQADGITIISPDAGSLACGEIGEGRLADVDTLVAVIMHTLKGDLPLKGKKALVTSGPTYEPIDPVRFIGNRSSGRQGHAIAAALAHAGAEVTLISGPVAEPFPGGVKVINVEKAQEMLDCTMQALPTDIAVCVAAVSDWRVKAPYAQKLKKRANLSAPAIELIANPDILQSIATLKKNRPELVIGFAAETETLAKNALAKLQQKKCDWIIANDVSDGKVFAKDATSVLFISADGMQAWDKVSKADIAHKLVQQIIQYWENPHGKRRPRPVATRR